MTDTRHLEHRIVIAGGGAAGLELAVKLARAKESDVLLIDREPIHVWKPRLHELAAGLEAGVTRFDFAAVAEQWGFAFHQGSLADIDPDQKRISLSPIQDSQGHELAAACTIGYQVLILALGGTTPDFGVEGVLDHALPLDSAADAHAIFQRFSVGLLDQSMAGAALNVVIVGSGATGVELAAYMATFQASKALAPRARLPQVNINVLEAAGTFMPGVAATVREQASGHLRHAKVGMHAGQQVSEVSARTVKTKGGGEFPSHLTVWATGRVGPPLADRIQTLETTRKRQWKVTPTLQSTASEAIFALGDCSYCEPAPAPPTAQAAREQAVYLVDAIPRFLNGQPLGNFTYKDNGTLLSLGEAGTLGKVRGLFSKDILLHGRLAHAAYNGLQRQHQYTVMGWHRGTLQVLSELFGRRARPPLKVPWGIE